MGPAGEVQADGIGSRICWLGHPVFLLCAAVLLVNDQVLKAEFANWWTGKVSDVAGVALVAMLLAAVVGARGGVVIAGAGFTLLKTAPGVAELAAPILGGVTRRDPTDLLALVVLIPVYLWLDRLDGGRSRPRTTHRAGWAPLRSGLAVIAPILGAIVAVGATTATSCADAPSVANVISTERNLYAFVVGGDDGAKWGVSADGGETWQRTIPPTGVAAKAHVARKDLNALTRPDPGVCAPDGTCWRVRNREVIERVDRGGAVTREFSLLDDGIDFQRSDRTCGVNPVDVLSVLVRTESNGNEHRVIATLGANGVLVRESDGTWHEVGVLDAKPAAPERLTDAVTKTTLGFGPVMAVGIWLLGERRLPSRRNAVIVVLAGWGTTIGAVYFIDLVTSTNPWVTLACGVVITAVLGVLTGRRPVPPRYPYLLWPPLPPPPPPPPPPSKSAHED